MAYNRRLLYTKTVPSWDTPSGDLGAVIQNGNPITSIQLSASNDPASEMEYTVTSGSLPTGLTLSLSGEISGTLTGYSSSETVNFSITATDAEGESLERSFFLNVLPEYQIDYLVIAGGGSGGNDHGGGGGAGGYRTSYGTSGANSTPESSITTISGQNIYTITVGSGGASAPAVRAGEAPRGHNGTDSSIGSLITSIGGGGAGGSNQSPYNSGLNGGSGGGSSGYGDTPHPAGSGTANQGFDGGIGTNNSPYQGGGGGGAGAPGYNSNYYFSSTTGIYPDGGDGLASTITGTTVTRAGGGGGGISYVGDGRFGDGGAGGGGRGANSVSAGVSGVTNTGSGGGGAVRYTNDAGGGVSGPTGAGGSGVVILRMPTSNYSGTTTGSPSVTTDGADTILTYTGSGTYTA